MSYCSNLSLRPHHLCEPIQEILPSPRDHQNRAILLQGEATGASSPGPGQRSLCSCIIVIKKGSSFICLCWQTFSGDRVPHLFPYTNQAIKHEDVSTPPGLSHVIKSITSFLLSDIFKDKSDCLLFSFALLEILAVCFFFFFSLSFRLLVLSRSVVSDSLRPHGLKPARLLCPWDSPGKNTGVGCHALLQGIFPTQGSNSGLPCCRQILYRLSHQGSPRILVWVAYPFSRGSSQSRNGTRVSCNAGGFFTS